MPGPVARAGEGSNQRWAAGGVLILLGGIALVEGWRLHALRTEMVAGAVVGDDTLPLDRGRRPARPRHPRGRRRTTAAREGRRCRPAPSAPGCSRRRACSSRTGSSFPTSATRGAPRSSRSGLYRTMGSYRWPVGDAARRGDDGAPLPACFGSGCSSRCRPAGSGSERRAVDVLGQLAGGFAAALAPTNLLMAALGALLGTLVGVLPGLGPTAAIAILFPLTTVLAPVPAIIMLAGHLLRRHVRRLHHRHPPEHPGRGGLGADVPRRLPDGPPGPRRRRARHRGHRLVLRGDARRRRPHVLRPAPGRPGAAVRPARVLRPHGAGLHGGGVAVQRLAAQGASPWPRSATSSR